MNELIEKIKVMNVIELQKTRDRILVSEGSPMDKDRILNLINNRLDKPKLDTVEHSYVTPEEMEWD